MPGRQRARRLDCSTTLLVIACSSMLMRSTRTKQSQLGLMTLIAASGERMADGTCKVAIPRICHTVEEAKSLHNTCKCSSFPVVPCAHPRAERISIRQGRRGQTPVHVRSARLSAMLHELYVMGTGKLCGRHCPYLCDLQSGPHGQSARRVDVSSLLILTLQNSAVSQHDNHRRMRSAQAPLAVRYSSHTIALTFLRSDIGQIKLMATVAGIQCPIH